MDCLVGLFLQAEENKDEGGRSGARWLNVSALALHVWQLRATKTLVFRENRSRSLMWVFAV